MTFLSRWRKKPQNFIVISPDLIREVIAEDIEFPINTVLYDYVRDLTDRDLEWLGEQIVQDDEIWLILTDFIISHTLSMRFNDLLLEAGLEQE